MDYLSFLKNKDKNRRRKKNLVIYGLYLLIPVFLIASTFTNERIITKCEDIYHEKVVYEQLVVEKEGQIRHLAEVCSTRVDSLSRLLGISTGDIKSITDDLDDTQASNEELLKRIAALEAALAAAQDSIRELEETLSGLRAENANLAAQIRQLKESNARKDASIESLRNRLSACEDAREEAERKYEACKSEYNALRSRYNALKETNQQLVAERDRYKRLYEAEKNKNASLKEQNEALKRERDRFENSYQQLKEEYDRLLMAGSAVSIVKEANYRGNDFMWIERGQSYRVIVNGRVVKHIKGDPCLR